MWFPLPLQDLLDFLVLQDNRLLPPCQALAQLCAPTHAFDPVRHHVAVAKYL